MQLNNRMTTKSARCAKTSGDPLEMRLCRFEKMTKELEMRLTSFGKKKRTKNSTGTK
jgi:hypothetical protein